MTKSSLGLILLCSAIGLDAYAGGSGLNTVVIVNQSSTNSLELGNYYCERRQVPPENVLRINWPGSNLSWDSNQFQINLVNPLLAMLADRQLTNQVDYVVLSMDIPYQTVNGLLVNATTSALFYGVKIDYGPASVGVTNSYAGSEQSFAQARPASAPGYSFLTTMITGNSLAQAKKLVDQGVAGDGTFPGQRVMLAKSSDTARNLRYRFFDNAIFNTRLRQDYAIVRTNCDSLWGQGNLLGLETGLAYFTIPTNTFVAGAMADSMTSYAGVILAGSDQTTLLAMINAGAAGSYGTVTEPAASTAKFPNPQNYFYQARGFSLAECYYQSLLQPFEGLIVGEPLAAPFQQIASGKWTGSTSNVVLSGAAQLAVQFSAHDAEHPLQRIDLFVDGKYFQTLTNLAPRPGNVLTVALNGYPITYAVPTNASIPAVAAGLAARLNDPATTNLTKVAALIHGDRLELRSLSTNPLADPVFYSDAVPPSSVTRFYRIAYLPDSFPPLLTSSGRDPNGAFRLHVNSAAPALIMASTNLADWVPIGTNLSAGSLDILDWAATNYSRRFYRLAGVTLDKRPKLSLLGSSMAAGARLHVESQTLFPYVVQTSPNLTTWTPVLTNQIGGVMDFVDAQAANSLYRFYRAVVLSTVASLPTVTAMGIPGAGNNLLRIDGAVRPYVVQVSTNLLQWTSLMTNFNLGAVQTSVSSSPGSADLLSSFLTASRDTFLDSAANGFRYYSVNGTFQIGSWLQLSVAKINGATLALAVTNQSSNATVMDLASNLVDLVNSSPDLQGNDGLVAEDFAAGFFGAAVFTLRARAPGLKAAAIQTTLSSSGELVCNPQAALALNSNLSDLQPRNHLYLSAGATALALAFPLDTTAVADGFHELTAVAYEGSSVRTQTRATLAVEVKNSPLSASLALLDMGATAAVQGTYHLQVTANTNNVSAIRLYSTGGVLDTVSNQPTASFTISGGSLGAGLHPFYAVVETATGQAFRTQKQWVRLLNGP